MSSGWRQALVDQLEELNRWVRGRYVEAAGPDGEVAPAERYLDLDFLAAAIRRSQSTSLHVRQPVPAGYDVPPLADDDVDVRAAISRFVRIYAASVSCIAQTALACGVGLDLSLPRCRMIIRHNLPMFAAVDFDDDAVARCRERPAAWPVDRGPVVETLDELRGYVWERLYAGHLAPVMARVHQISKVSDRLIWSNCAEWVGMVSDAAGEYLPPERARPFLEDRVALLEAETLPGLPGPNPMRNLLAWEPAEAPELPHGLQTRRVCCLIYLVPDRYGRLCQNCNLLPAPDRVALIQERHAQAQGTAGGPAERRSIEVGLEKLGHARR